MRMSRDSLRAERLNWTLSLSFLDMVRKYTDITELTAEIIRTFVEKIEVMKPEKVPGTRTKKQTIVITGISSELSRSPIPKRKRHNQNNA